MILPRILSVGKDKTLMASRTLLLSNSGYAVEEAHSIEKAISLLEADSIDATVICHTIPKRDQSALISAVREKRRLMPILCIRSYAYETAPRTCVAVDNEPEALLKTLKLATAPPMRISS
jgi:DNA-binding response OmpR family regulator